jgi:hypothetical protein
LIWACVAGALSDVVATVVVMDRTLSPPGGVDKG